MGTVIFDCCHLRVLILVDHVLVDGQIHQTAYFVFLECLAKGRQILTGMAVQIQFIVYDLIDGAGILFAVGKDFSVGRSPGER